MLNNYKTIKVVPMTGVGVMRDPEWPAQMVTFLTDTEQSLLNEALADGWEIIQFVTHCSPEHNITGITAILGKP